jgi:hypothetical protein
MGFRATAAVLVVAAVAIVAAGFTSRTKLTVSKPPRNVKAGTTWDALVQITREGRRLDGYRTAIEIEDELGHQTFPGREVKPGLYRVRVVFPRIGKWSYQVRVGRITRARGTLRVIPN